VEELNAKLSFHLFTDVSMVDLKTVMLPIASIKQQLPKLQKVNSLGPHSLTPPLMTPLTCGQDAVPIADMPAPLQIQME
jgi:hypothetical protein